MHVIVHPGFHKTGTTSLQAALRTNRKKLSPDIRILLKDDMPSLTATTKAYSVSMEPLDLALVIYEAGQVAESIPADTKTVILSSESLCGQIPGRNNVKDYRAAPRLMGTLYDAFSEAHPTAKLSFFFSTRDRQPWLASCYTQHLRASRMTLSADNYIETFTPSSDLEKIVRDCVGAVPMCGVVSVRIEDSGKTRLGLLDRMLDIAGYPKTSREALTPVANLNTSPTPAQVAALLEVNRSNMSDTQARAARTALNKGTP